MSATVSAWNPRFTAYAVELGLSENAALERDRRLYPGGVMTGYMGWCAARWAEFDRERGTLAYHMRSADEHASFDAWLDSRAIRYAAQRAEILASVGVRS